MSLIAFGEHMPRVADTVWLAPTSTLIGRVTIGAESSVFFGAVLRGDSSEIAVGERSNLQDNVVVHADPGFPTRIADGSLVAGVPAKVRRELTDDERDGIRTNGSNYVALSRAYGAS